MINVLGYIDRTFELIHKTNQFNLTTKRLSLKELGALASRDDCFCYSYSLKDKYSDYGIISVFIAERVSDAWVIDTWLMSCRAMGRGVENAVFDHFLSSAVTVGETVLGTYRATEKNGPVSDLLAKMGFLPDPETGGDSFRVGKNINPKAAFIELSSRMAEK